MGGSGALSDLIHRICNLSVTATAGAASRCFLIVVSLAILAVPAYVINSRIEQQAHAYVSDDRNDLALPIEVEKFAVIQPFYPSTSPGKSVTGCDGFCLHALLSGVAQSVLIVETEQPHAPLEEDLAALEFTIERLPQCPAPQFSSGDKTLSFPFEYGAEKRKSADAFELMKLRMSQGDCLVTRKAKLSDADLIISRGRVISGVRYEAGLGFSLVENTIRADRIAVYEKLHGKKFKQIYRWTGVWYRPLAWILVPAPLFGHGFDVNTGWLRLEREINTDSKLYGDDGWRRFLTDTLGLDLHIDRQELKESSVAQIRDVLEQERPPTNAEWGSISTYFNNLGIGRSNHVEEIDVDLAHEILKRPYFPTPPSLSRITPYAGKKSSPDVLENLTGVIFQRLENAVGRMERGESVEDDELNNLVSGLRFLPDDYLLPYFNRHVRLVAKPAIQRHGRSFLSKLHVYGARAVPTLLDLIEIGLSGGDDVFRKPEYTNPYLGGLVGLCRAGEKANTALPTLLEWTLTGRLPSNRSSNALLVRTLVRIGADPETLRTYFSKADPTYSEEHFDLYVRRARSDSPDCSY